VYRIGDDEANVAVDTSAFVESLRRLLAGVGLHCDDVVASECYRGDVVLDAGVSVGVRGDGLSIDVEAGILHHAVELDIDLLRVWRARKGEVLAIPRNARWCVSAITSRWSR